MAGVPGDLDELFERLVLCREKAQALNAQIISVGNQSVKHWLERAGPGAGTIKGQLSQHPPVALRSEIGMLVNEQRAILDNLVDSVTSANLYALVEK